MVTSPSGGWSILSIPLGSSEVQRMRPSVPRVVDPIATMPERMLGGETQCVEGQAMGKEGEVVETRRWGRRAQRGGGHGGGQTGRQG
jgi:hypothetical protein